MDPTTYILITSINAMLTMAFLLLGFFLFDKLTPKWDFSDVFKEKGVSGGAIVVSAYIVGLALVLAAASY